MGADYIAVTGIEHLIELLKAEPSHQLDGFIIVGGCGRSSKDIILHEDDSISCLHNIDDTMEHISAKRIKKADKKSWFLQRVIDKQLYVGVR